MNSGNYPLLEPLWRPDYRINPQPTIPYNPFVGAEILNDEGKYEEITDESGIDVSYQWYTVEENIKDVTKENLTYDTLPETEQLGTYSGNVWESVEDDYEPNYQSIFISFKVQEDDVITVTPSEGFSVSAQGWVGEVDSPADFVKSDNKCTYRATEDCDFVLWVYEMTSSPFTAQITITRKTTTLVDGRTYCHLIYNKDKNGDEDRSGLVSGKEYLCEVTFAPKVATLAAESADNSVTLYSDSVIYNYELTEIKVTEQPKLIYTDGDALDLSAMVVTAYYSDGSSKTLDDTEFETSIEDGATLTMADNGETITITYNGKTADTDALTVQQKQSDEEEPNENPNENPNEDFNHDFFNWSVMMLFNQEYEITADTTDGGKITPEGVAKVKYDRNITYTITPDEGYMVSDVLVDDKSVGAVTEYTFKRVKEDHTITVIFAEIP